MKQLSRKKILSLILRLPLLGLLSVLVHAVSDAAVNGTVSIYPLGPLNVLKGDSFNVSCSTSNIDSTFVSWLLISMSATSQDLKTKTFSSNATFTVIAKSKIEITCIAVGQNGQNKSSSLLVNVQGACAHN